MTRKCEQCNQELPEPTIEELQENVSQLKAKVEELEGRLLLQNPFPTYVVIREVPVLPPYVPPPITWINTATNTGPFLANTGPSLR